MVASHVTPWEVAIKLALGRLTMDVPYEVVFPKVLDANGFKLLPTTLDHFRELISLPRHHGDPFDRLLIAAKRRSAGFQTCRFAGFHTCWAVGRTEVRWDLARRSGQECLGNGRPECLRYGRGRGRRVIRQPTRPSIFERVPVG